MPSRTPYEEWIQREQRRRRVDKSRTIGALVVIFGSAIFWLLVSVFVL